MRFFDEGNFEESDEELEADSALSSAWSCVDYPREATLSSTSECTKGRPIWAVFENTQTTLTLREPRAQLEAHLRWVFKSFDVPPAGANRPVQRDRSVADKDDLDVARSLEKATKSKLA